MEPEGDAEVVFLKARKGFVRCARTPRLSSAALAPLGALPCPAAYSACLCTPALQAGHASGGAPRARVCVWPDASLQILQASDRLAPPPRAPGRRRQASAAAWQRCLRLLLRQAGACLHCLTMPHLPFLSLIIALSASLSSLAPPLPTALCGS